MLRSVSQNNLDLIEIHLKKMAFEKAVIIDYAENLDPFLAFLVKTNEFQKITCFTEKEPVLSFPIAHRHVSRWSIRDYWIFFTTGGAKREPDIDVLYDGDEERLPSWRRSVAMGIFYRYYRRLNQISSFVVFKQLNACFWMTVGILSQFFVLPLRCKKGSIQGRMNDTEIEIFFDGSPEKDHYGENPLLEAKYRKYESVIRDLSAKNTRAVFFIVTGPRQLYIERLAVLSKLLSYQSFSIFAAALFRPQAYRLVESLMDGQFLKGNNHSIYGETVYSDHCLSIEAGERELWLYSPMKDVDVASK